MRNGSNGERGSVVVSLTIVLLVAALVAVSIAAAAVGSVRSADAQWAADATALAIAAEGVSPDGIDAGRAVAQANGANLLTVSVGIDSAVCCGPDWPPPEDGSDDTRLSTVVAVNIEKDGVRATAAAGVVYSQEP